MAKNEIPNLNLWPEPSPFQNRESRLQKEHNISELMKYWPQLGKWSFDTEERLNNLINGVEQPNELVDAHISGVTGQTFKTTKERLDYMEENAATKESLQLSGTYGTLHRLGQKYRTQGAVGSNAQGFASLGNQIVVQYFQNYSPLDTQYGTLIKFDVTDGNEMLTNEIKGFHGNSMTYNSDDGFLYLAPAEDSSSAKEQGQKTTIIKIDAETLSVQASIDLAQKTQLSVIHAVGYDNADHVFMISDEKNIEVYDTNWKLLYKIELKNIIGFTPDFMQGLQINGDTLYWIGGRRSQIWVFKIDHENKTLNFKTQYTFDDFQENLYPIGEIEGLGFNYNTGQIYVASHISVGNFGGLVEYFVTNDDFRIASQGGRTASIQNSNASQVVFYAGNNSNYNPDGTKHNPFASLLEATTCMRTPYTPFKQLQLTSDFTEETLLFSNVSNAMFTPAGFKVKASVIINCSNLYLTQLDTVGWSHWNKNALYIFNSNIRINGYTATGVDSNDVTDVAYIERSQVFANISSTVSTKLVNAELTVPVLINEVAKENSMAVLHGKKKLGRITSLANSTTLDTSDFSYYKKMEVNILTAFNGTDIRFHLSSFIDGDVVNFAGYSEARGTIYLVSFHYVRGNNANTTLKFFKLNDMSRITPASFSIDGFVTDD